MDDKIFKDDKIVSLCCNLALPAYLVAGMTCLFCFYQALTM